MSALICDAHRSCSTCYHPGGRDFLKMHYHHGLLQVTPELVWGLHGHFLGMMARRRLSDGERWRIIGMIESGMSRKAVARTFGYHHSVISRLVQKHQETDAVKDRPRSGRPRVTTVRQDRALLRLVRRYPFASSNFLKDNWLPNRRLCHRTVRNRLKSAGLRSRRVIKRPRLLERHQRERLAWCLARRGWNIRSWRRVHWSDESRFLVYVTDGRVRVWRHKNTAYAPKNIQPTVPFGGGSIMVWGCFSHDCKLDLITVRGNLNGERYAEEILNTTVIPHFDDHTLASRPIFMDDNARPHRARRVRALLEQGAVTTIPWPAYSPDLNPLEHVWDMLGRKIAKMVPPIANLDELERALHREWNNLPQQRIRRLTGSMRRRVESVIRSRGSYTRY